MFRGLSLGALAALLALPAHAQRFTKLRANVSTVPGPVAMGLFDNPATECSGGTTYTMQGIFGNRTLQISRGLAAYCERSDGTLVSVPAHELRINNNGVLIEGSRTNLVVRSQELDNAAWTKTNVAVPTANNQTDPAAGTTAELGSTTAAGGHYQSTAFVPSQTTGAASFYVKTTSGTQGGALVVRDTSANADRATCTYTATTTYQRVVCNWSGGTGANNHALRWFPGGTAGEGSSVAWGFQAEGPAVTGLSATSYIPTAAAAVTRPNETVLMGALNAADAAGCISLTATWGATSNATGTVIANNSSVKVLGLSALTAAVAQDGTNTATASPITSVIGRSLAMKSTWGADGLAVLADGVSGSTSYDGSVGSTANLYFGSVGGSSSFSYVTIKNFKFGNHPRSCE